jgi:5-dehydro-2-deoxygluconokinase
LARSFAVAARYPLVKGFAVGRTIFADAAASFMKGNISDDAAIADMAEKYTKLCTLWDNARANAKGE